MAVQILRPNGVGDDDEWAKSSGTTAWELLDETGAHDGDSTYIYTTAISADTLVHLTDFVEPGEEYTVTIMSIMLKVVAKKSVDAESNDFHITAKLPITNTILDSVTLTDSYVEYPADLNELYTISVWTIDDLNALQVGVKNLDTDANEVRVTQMWVEVTYTIGPAFPSSGSSGCYANGAGPIQILRPTGVGVADDWSKSTGTTAYDLIDEVDDHDGDATHIWTDTYGAAVMSSLTDFASVLPVAIMSVIVKYVAKKTVDLGANDFTFGPMVYAGSGTEVPYNHDLTTEYKEYSLDITNHFSFTPWTTTKLNDLQIGGIKNSVSAEEIHITQMWVEVWYYPMQTLRPNAVGDVDQWLKSAAVAAYTLVDESGNHDGDSTYIYSSTLSDHTRVNLGNMGGSVGTIVRILLKLVALTEIPGVSSDLDVTIKTASGTNTVASHSLTESYQEYTDDITADPVTVPWNTTKLNALQIGVQHVDAGLSEIRVTQMYVEVAYRLTANTGSRGAYISGFVPTPTSSGSFGAYVFALDQNSGSLGLYVLGYVAPTGTVQTLRPTSDGAYDAWSTSAGTSSADLVRESGAHDGDSTYIWSNTINQKTTLNVDDFTPAFYQITRVVLKFVAKKNFGSGTHALGTVAIIDGIEDQHASFDLANTYAEYESDLTAGSLAWTRSIVDGMQVGFVRYLAASNYIRVTQVWVEVTYSLPGTVDTGAIGSYVKGHAPQDGSLGSYAAAREPDTGSFGSFAQSSGTSVGSLGAFSAGRTAQAGSLGAYSSGPSDQINIAPISAYVSGAAPQTGSYGAFALAIEPGSGESGAYAAGFLTDSGSVGLYARSVEEGSGSYGAFAQGPTRLTGSHGAYTRGAGRSRVLYRITAIEGPVTGSWARVFGDMVGRARLHQDSENEASGSILTTLTAHAETWPWSEGITNYVNTCHFPSTTLYPSPTIYPC